MPKEFHQTEWDDVIADECRRLIRAAVLEDLDRGQDWTTVSLVPMEATGQAALVARQAGVIVGLPAVQLVIDEMDRRMRFLPAASANGKVIRDGQTIQPDAKLAMITGPARSLLTAERLILNFIGRLSGIATLTKRFVEAAAGTKARIYDTRKTTPGWRRLEKYAVRQGGGQNHRTGLFDAILIKDNHLALGGTVVGAARFSPIEAVRQARQFIAESFPDDDPRRQMIVEIEVDSIAQLEPVLRERPDIILLDNMCLENLRAAVALRNHLASGVALEASGRVTLETVKAIAETGVDRISAGSLTHSATSLDVGLDWLEKSH
ncbi:MAG TPA: carboxylating nicotinate-nucleotide diphosphorylase [Pirellulales bacterium]|jgi:nicotinate-nucleotide pyrophosphorylase (carboxylating)|nr:carboxylating nicotinate-nucleotide diphosphorylase [Pirellulales bacterium]